MNNKNSPLQSVFLPAFVGAALGCVAILLFTQYANQSGRKPGAPQDPPAAPSSPLHSKTLQRKISNGTQSPNTVMSHGYEQSSESPDRFNALELDNGFTPLIGTIKSISQRPEGAPVLMVGIAGGSGSGKTTLAQAIYTALGREENVTFISHDSYYKDLSSWTMAQREQQNFDHPNSLDTDLLVEHLKSLKSGEKALIPNYDFTTHSRTGELTLALPRRVILVEGILIFTEPALTDLLDVKIFVDTESDVRLIRRVTRDCQERGRSLDQVLEQYTKTVRPMHIEFVEPSKRQADIIVPVGINSVALSLITDHLRTALEKADVQYLKTPFDEENKRERGQLTPAGGSASEKLNMQGES